MMPTASDGIPVYGVAGRGRTGWTKSGQNRMKPGSPDGLDGSIHVAKVRVAGSNLVVRSKKSHVRPGLRTRPLHFHLFCRPPLVQQPRLGPTSVTSFSRWRSTGSVRCCEIAGDQQHRNVEGVQSSTHRFSVEGAVGENWGRLRPKGLCRALFGGLSTICVGHLDVDHPRASSTAAADVAMAARRLVVDMSDTQSSRTSSVGLRPRTSLVSSVSTLPLAAAPRRVGCLTVLRQAQRDHERSGSAGHCAAVIAER